MGVAAPGELSRQVRGPLDLGVQHAVRDAVADPYQPFRRGGRGVHAASGAANATLAAYLHASNALPRADGRYVVSQGREVGHDARLELHVDADGEVWSGGQVQTVVRGQLDW